MRNLDNLKKRAAEYDNLDNTTPFEWRDILADLRLAIHELEWFYILLTRFCPTSIPEVGGPTIGRHYIDENKVCVELVKAQSDVLSLRKALDNFWRYENEPINLSWDDVEAEVKGVLFSTARYEVQP